MSISALCPQDTEIVTFLSGICTLEETFKVLLSTSQLKSHIFKISISTPTKKLQVNSELLAYACHGHLWKMSNLYFFG